MKGTLFGSAGLALTLGRSPNYLRCHSGIQPCYYSSDAKPGEGVCQL